MLEFTKNEAIELSGLSMKSLEQEVYYEGKEISLTKREFIALYLLMSYKGQVLSKRQIYEQITNDLELKDYHRIEVLISRLRRKLEKISGRKDFIITVRERGYKFTKSP